MISIQRAGTHHRRTMTSKTGKSFRISTKTTNRNGLTFVEVMVAVVVLAVGITAVYRSYVLAIDRMDHLTKRVYATTMIDDRIMRLERFLRAQKAIPMDSDKKEAVDIDGKRLEFDQYVQIRAVDDLPNIFQVDLRLQWKENQREVTMRRSAYIADFYLANPRGSMNPIQFKRTY